LKVVNSDFINSFGGINFILNSFDEIGLAAILDTHLPAMPSNAQYSWKDIFYSLYAVFFCGGDCAEDLQFNLNQGLADNPFLDLPSSDTVLRRLKQLSGPVDIFRTPRGAVDHQFALNESLNKLNIALLKSLGVFDSQSITIDYDNTIIFNEKADSKTTYKRFKGYQPAVATVNINHILYLENRNGNSDAKSLQVDSLHRMFECIADSINQVDFFRADAASYQYDVVRLVAKHVKHFYIGARPSYIESAVSQIDNWQPYEDKQGNKVLLGQCYYTPFKQSARRKGQADQVEEYRLIVRKKIDKKGQGNLFTGDAHEYFAVLTNDFTTELEEVWTFYNQRGAMERQFDILKNDFGWNNMPFSKLNENAVFLIIMAMCRNLYQHIITSFSKKYKGLKSSFRIKKFIYRFIAIPAKWIRKSRQWQLRIYGEIHLRI